MPPDPPPHPHPQYLDICCLCVHMNEKAIKGAWWRERESVVLIYFSHSKRNRFGLPLHLICLLYTSTLENFCSKLFVLLKQFTLADWWCWDAICSSCSASSRNAVIENSDSVVWMRAEPRDWWCVWTSQFIPLFIPICAVLSHATIGYVLCPKTGAPEFKDTFALSCTEFRISSHFILNMLIKCMYFYSTPGTLNMN